METRTPDARYLTRDQVRSVDRQAIDNYGVPGVVLMENAGRGTAELLLREGVNGPVVVCCGKGNNGGDGFVIARHLELAGHSVRILCTQPIEELAGDALTNAVIARNSGLPIEVIANPIDPSRLDEQLHVAAWIVDALLGTGTQGTIREQYAGVIEAINRAPGQVLAVDLPSGLDCDSGDPLGPCVQADLTATFVALKQGFANPGSQAYTGRTEVVGIGAPRRLLQDMGVDTLTS